MIADKATSIPEVLSRMSTLSGDVTEVHHEADMLLCDALILLDGGAVVAAFMAARSKHRFDY